MSTWGVVATIKAPTLDTLNFAAHHIELGAHRVYIYLDAPDPDAVAALKDHPKTRVTDCDRAYWKKRIGKPQVKHQVRQTLNATHEYNRRAEVDWLIHIDADEFLWPQTSLTTHLGALPSDVLCARVPPIEAIAGDGTLFKGYIPGGPDRAPLVERIYPRYGRYVKGGFLSHVAGKLFVRTGLTGIELRIHNMFQNGEMNPQERWLRDVELCHCHAKSWEDWLATFRYRLEMGSYRQGLAAATPHDLGGLTLHELFTLIEAEEGEAGLRQFYDEVCADTPDLRARLQRENLLRVRDLTLDAKRRKHFPQNP
ncbi:MAG: glycosyltransferase family 2 protein [Sedimentitalea sp.]